MNSMGEISLFMVYGLGNGTVSSSN